MSRLNTQDKLPLNLRILIGVVAIPSLVLAGMLGVMTFNGQFQEISIFEWIYSIAGFVALYIAVTGKRLF
ncbi:hypothetical protein L0668_00550 [Paraglaciecola aquimarina]|uniref:Uncharacterized protein n=1 Tax=Paraglaciecola algarum TaxID=3050085 RepID=A0ABS9D144_9ALTE|nr:hypothetical protein [Paraglaciecola sp. G1-23]MCF2946581.1 hypothetical protein [Paraglaciecola sp. G1-23]